jgi:hypothetical protein
MNQFVEKALLHLTGKSDIDLVSTEDLERIVNDFPYFSVAHVFLSKKLHLSKSEAFLPQVQKTALYFTNPYWLHYQLMNDLLTLNLDSSKNKKAPTIEVKEEHVNREPSEFEVTENGTIRFTQQEINEASQLAKHTLQEGPAEENAPLEISESETKLTEVPPGMAATTDRELDQVSKEAEQDKLKIPTDEDPQTEPSIAENFIVQKGQVNNPFGVPDKVEHFNAPSEPEALEEGPHPSVDFTQQPDVHKDVHSLDNPLIVEDVVQPEEVPEQNEEQKTGENVNGNYVLSNLSGQIEQLNDPVGDIEKIDLGEPSREQLSTDDEYVLSNLSHKISHLDNPAENIEKIDLEESPEEIDSEEQAVPDPFHPEEEEILEELDQDKTDKSEPKTVKTPEPAESQSIITAEKVDTTKETGSSAIGINTPIHGPLIPIEPYYTIDYFASQGIKFVLERNPQDKLGKQLRSFTDWLKHMKRLGPEDALKSTEDSQVESKIQTIADSSNITKDVVTEAMAEVLVKQGKNQQAVEVYNKLSFLHPDKSTYFASQIKKLKGI